MRRTLMALSAVAFSLLCAGCGGGGGGGGQSSPPPGTGTPMPDLQIDNQVQMTSASGMMHLRFQVVNSFDPGAPATNVSWRVIRRVNDQQVASGSIAQLADGARADVEAMVDDVDDGQVFRIEVDPQDAVAEAVESNNQADITAITDTPGPPSGALDLVFNDAHYHGMYYYSDPRFHFYVMNRNDQGLAAPAFTFQIYDGTQLIHTGRVSGIAAPTAAEPFPTRMVEFTLPEQLDAYSDGSYASRPAPGRHEFTIHLDTGHEIEEANELNNTHRMVVEVPAAKTIATSPGEVVDIQHQDPHFHQFPTHVAFHFFLRNLHASEARDIPWRLVRDDGVVIDEGSSRVQPMANFDISFRYDDERVGEPVFTLTLDPDDEVEEADEANNQVRFIIDWTPTGAG